MINLVPSRELLSSPQAPLAPMAWQAQVLLQLLQLAILATGLWAVIRFMPWWRGFGGTWVILSPVLFILKLMLIVAIGAPLLFFTGMAVGTEINTYQRSHTAPTAGLNLPTVRVIGDYVPDRRTWVLLGGTEPSAQIAYLRSRDGRVVPGSAMSELAGKVNIVTFDTPRYGLDETTAFPYLFQQLTAINGGHPNAGGLVFCAESNGTAIVDRLLAPYGAAGVTPAGTVRGVIHLFPLRGKVDVKPAAQVLMTIFYPYSSNPFLDLLVRWETIGNLITPPDLAAQKVAESQPGGASWYPEMREDNVRFPGNYLANVNTVSRSNAFNGPPLTTDYPIYALRLPDGKDGFLREAQGAAAVKRRYPHAVVQEIPWGGHGQLPEYGPQYAQLLRELNDRINQSAV